MGTVDQADSFIALWSWCDMLAVSCSISHRAVVACIWSRACGHLWIFHFSCSFVLVSTNSWGRICLLTCLCSTASFCVSSLSDQTVRNVTFKTNLSFQLQWKPPAGQSSWRQRQEGHWRWLSVSAWYSVCMMISWLAIFDSEWTLCLVSAGSHLDQKHDTRLHHAGPSDGRADNSLLELWNQIKSRFMLEQQRSKVALKVHLLLLCEKHYSCLLWMIMPWL